MGTSQENAEDARFIDILAHLPYACSAVERLAGGSVNCICRGSLVDPLPDGSRSVVIRQCSDVTRSVCLFLAIKSVCLTIFFPDGRAGFPTDGQRYWRF